MMIRRFFVIAFILFGFTLAHADEQNHGRKFKDCTEEQIQALLQAETDAKTEGESLLAEIQAAANDKNRLGRIASNDRRLHKSSKILSCAIRKIGKMNYKCTPLNYKYVAKTQWWFTNKKIWVTENFFNGVGNPFSDASNIIHELTHKCATTDAAYFRRSQPHNTRIFGWPMIADTYSYWINKGFCVPGETCY